MAACVAYEIPYVQDKFITLKIQAESTHIGNTISEYSGHSALGLISADISSAIRLNVK